MQKTWKTLPRQSEDLVEQLLLNRRIPKEEWSSFLKPDFHNLFDPYLMKNMKKAVERLMKARKQKEKIGIFGDYDADGIPGTALLYEYFNDVGIKSYVYIPTREQGYGLNKEGIAKLNKQGATLLITVDLGVRNNMEIEFAKKQGLDVIVLDHHESGKALPKCVVIDPKQKGDKYPFRELSATGVVFKFIQAANSEERLLGEGQLKWMLDLVGISTICDVVPLVSENRIFARFGLVVLSKTRRMGLRELYREAIINEAEIDAYTVGFQIGPRINAPGRIDDANESFVLLTTKNLAEARKCAISLNKINQKRQNELERVLSEAKAKVCREDLGKNKIIVVQDKNWPQGIVGLVAGKLMEEYARPVIVCERKGDKLKGSARSIEPFDILNALDKAKNYLIRYGGHKKAAGVSLELKHLSQLYDKLLEIAESKLTANDLLPKITIDVRVEPSDLNMRTLEKISQFEPFGLGNPRPVFLLENQPISYIKTVGKNNEHLKFRICDFGAIGFDLGKYRKDLKEGVKVSVVFTLSEDSWDGTSKLQLKVMDLKL